MTWFNTFQTYLDKKILDVFNETFLLSELRLIANELKRQDVLKRKALQTPIALYNNNQSELNSSNVIMGSGKHIADIVRNGDNVFNINIMVNKDDKTSMPFAKKPPPIPPQRPPPPIQQSQQQQATATQQQAMQQATPNSHNTPYNQNIQNILNSIGNKNNEAVSLVTNNASTVGNIGTIANVGAGINAVSSGADIRNTNIISNIVSATSGTSGATSGTSGATSGTSGATSGTSGATSGTSGSTSGTSGTSGASSGTAGATSGTAGATSGTAGTASGATSGTSGATSGTSGTVEQNYNTGEYDTSYEQELPSRIYNPIDYKYHYRGENGLPRPNVCSYGTKQIVQPIFLNSSTLFQGTDLREATENTQVGSIMPKFEYYEYEDTV
jgi:hypothetical protein